VQTAELSTITPDLPASPITQELTALEVALDHGDVRAARHRVVELRRRLEHIEAPTAPARLPRLRLVAGVPLTSREIAALQFLTDGSMSQKDIARAMGVTTNTVKTHLKSLYLKLGAHCRGEAIQRARDFGILPSTSEVNENESMQSIERSIANG